MPELIPGLIWILDFDEDPANRAAAAAALTPYRDSRAAPALRRALEREKDEKNRENIVNALLGCGGFSDEELAVAVEAYARLALTGEGKDKIEDALTLDSDSPLPLKVSVGRVLFDEGHEEAAIQVTEGLAARLVERARALRAPQPALARQILRVIEGSTLRAAEIDLVEGIGEGRADIESITSALEARDELRKGVGVELGDLLKRGGYAAGVAAVLLGDDREWSALLAGDDAKAQLALLACARYLREKLQVELVRGRLGTPNRALAMAAEKYLEVEDSPEARKLILARRPGEARILGDLSALSGDPTDIGWYKE
jgi:hypothetical protein